LKGWFTSWAAHGTLGLTAVGVVIQGLSIEIAFTTRSFRETNITSNTSKEGKSIRELGWLEENNFLVVYLSNCCMSFLGQREELCPVKFLCIVE
jgi:hypothetical protein